MTASIVGASASASGKKTTRMPVLFVGHGSPLNAIEENEFSRAWEDTAAGLPRPRAILSVSAHWQRDGARVTAMDRPHTIHDFTGFPDELYQIQYPAPGSPELARNVLSLPGVKGVALDTEWGLDHGTWAVLRRMYPAADIPVVQLCLDRGRTPAEHYALVEKLQPLRERGVLILGSGNMVHNLSMMEWTDKPFDWAVRFDQKPKSLIEARNHAALIDYPKLGRDAEPAIPTNEHYLPMLYALALRSADEPLRFFAEKVTMGSISMRAFQIG